MLDVRYSTKFKRDFKVCAKRGYNLKRLQNVIDILRVPDSLPPKNRDHNLTGSYAGYRECHVEFHSNQTTPETELLAAARGKIREDTWEHLCKRALEIAGEES